MVARFDVFIDNGIVHMIRRDVGDWVKYSDYEKLEQELISLRQDRAALSRFEGCPTNQVLKGALDHPRGRCRAETLEWIKQIVAQGEV